MKEKGVFVAHCPESNTNLSSGRRTGAAVSGGGPSCGLGSDVAGGSTEISLPPCLRPSRHPN